MIIDLGDPGDRPSRPLSVLQFGMGTHLARKGDNAITCFDPNPLRILLCGPYQGFLDFIFNIQRLNAASEAKIMGRPLWTNSKTESRLEKHWGI